MWRSSYRKEKDRAVREAGAEEIQTPPSMSFSYSKGAPSET